MNKVAIPLLAVFLAASTVLLLRTAGDEAVSTPDGGRETGRRPPARLRTEGSSFRTEDGRPFEWRGISAFRLAEMIAHGREREAIAFLDWAAAQKLSVVRVFVMAHHLFDLQPEDGLAALPRLLQLAAERELYVEAVALVDTGSIKLDAAAHMNALGRILAAHANSILEVANEPWHPTQDPRLHDAAFVKTLADGIPPSVTTALGSVEGGEGYAAGHFVTWHSPRKSGNDGWDHALAVAEGGALVTRWQKPTVSDEPVGAAAKAVPGRRDDNPARFSAAAALTRLAGLGATFHYEGGLHARIPSGPELACFEGWRSGLDLLNGLPDGGRFVAGAALDRTAEVQAARGVFARQYEHEIWILAVDPGDATTAEWRNGWQQRTVRDAPGARLFRAGR